MAQQGRIERWERELQSAHAMIQNIPGYPDWRSLQGEVRTLRQEGSMQASHIQGLAARCSALETGMMEAHARAEEANTRLEEATARCEALSKGMQEANTRLEEATSWCDALEKGMQEAHTRENTRIDLLLQVVQQMQLDKGV